MKRIIASVTLVTLAAAVASSPLLADDYVAAYTCKLNEGKKVEDVLAANSAWLKWVRANVNENISSHVGTAVVGNFDMFLFVDSYPDLATWATAVTALDTEAPDEIEAGLDAAAKCSENRLWRMRPTE
jgi:hypothetical protein